MSIKNLLCDKPALFYLLLVLSLALHVSDEAIFGFLDFYNPMALKLREYLIIFPPTFTFPLWITGLSLAVILLLLLTPLVYRRNRIFLRIAIIFAAIMILNGIGHFAFSIFYRKIVAGMLSSPLLILFSVCFILQIQRATKKV